MSDLRDISTPCLVLDRAKLQTNADFMAARAKALGVKLRPHMKTAKSADVARVATAGQFGGITVSTLAEAEYFFANGFADITLAVGFLPQRAPRALELAARGARLTLLADNEAAAREMPPELPVLIEVDCGDHRAGVPPDSDELLVIAALLAGRGVRVSGVLTHGGHSYNARTPGEIAAIARQERDAAVHAAGRLREAGFKIDTVSVGSTPTCTHAEDFAGCTEMRPGVYMLGDLDQAGLGSMPRERIAATVLTSVIGVYPAQNKVIVDAGGLALSKDASAQRHGERIGYGLVLDVNGEPMQGAWAFACSQEHGQIKGETPLPWDRLRVGTRLRIQPNHICMTAAAHPGYHVINGSTAMEAWWPRVNGWQSWGSPGTAPRLS
jgi:D-serine deaminase-like pyridoxal phosphate-dependent protein